ncbi:AMP-binding protein, partial [Embleya sp. NPDC005575]|uniref:AMP-binding protein n=1 Tax=Embleya sp. NPDC005575 TaxID=3156892 RepID=UPI0033BDC5F1
MTAVQARRHGVADLLARTAARLPNRLAIVAGELRQTFAEFDDAVSAAAGALAARGIGKGDRVVLLSRNSHGFAVAYFALARLGAISVPVNFMLTAPEVGYVLEHAGARAVLAGPELTDTADAAL